MSLVDRKLSVSPGLHTFPASAFGSKSKLLHPAHVRERDILLVACSELGSAPDNVSFQTPSRCVILQHLAGSIPSRDECESIEGLGSAFDSVEALFDRYDFRHVILSGHLHCGVIRNWLGPPAYKKSDIGSFRARFEKGTRDFVDENYKASNAERRFTLMVCEHVLCQIDNLLTHSFVADRVQSGATDLHGWILDDKTARVHGYSPTESAFLPL